MASRAGPTVDGTDGSDFGHRERVVSQYHTSAQTKGRLSTTLYLHMGLAVVLLAKLSPAIFDYLDIFILQLEEQNIPKPLLWEWIWFGSSFLAFIIGGNALRSSRSGKIKVFMGVVCALGFLPIFYAMFINWSDAYAFLFEKQSKVYKTWKGYPVALLWYVFISQSLIVHSCELYFASVLNDAWNLKRKRN